MSDITPLKLADRPEINMFFHVYPPSISEFTFTNLYVWRHMRPIWKTVINDSCIFLIDGGLQHQNKKIMLGPPAGNLSVSEALDYLQDQVAGAIRLPETAASQLQKNNIEVFADRNNYDYVYKVADLAELRGRHYSKKRNHVKRCLEKYQCDYESITDDNIEECAAMIKRWCTVRECSNNPGLCGEYQAIVDTFNHYVDFGLLGGAIRVDGVIQAFAVAEKLTPDTAVWHFEKAMPEIQGLAQLINKWFAQHHLKEFMFVNREQDLGISGLRQAKESYYPDHLVPKYNTMPVPPKSDITGCA